MGIAGRFVELGIAMQRPRRPEANAPCRAPRNGLGTVLPVPVKMRRRVEIDDSSFREPSAVSTKIPDSREAAQAAAADVLVRRHGESIAIESADSGLARDPTFGFAPGKPAESAP